MGEVQFQVKDTYLDKTPFQTVVCIGSKRNNILQYSKIADLRNGLLVTKGLRSEEVDQR